MCRMRSGGGGRGGGAGGDGVRGKCIDGFTPTTTIAIYMCTTNKNINSVEGDE